MSSRFDHLMAKSLDRRLGSGRRQPVGDQHIELGGEGNLSRFGAALREYLGRINKSPETDQDFADCESAVKTLKAAEDALDAASAATIAQVEPVANATRTIDTLRELARTNRLQLEKIVKVEKENRKLAMVTDAQGKANAHWQAAAQSLGGILPQITHEFPAVIKGLKSIDSMRDNPRRPGATRLRTRRSRPRRVPLPAGRPSRNS